MQDLERSGCGLPNYAEDEMNKLFDLYMDELDIKNECYELMGQLLNRPFIKKQVKKFDVHKVYVYGGGFIGIQLYRELENIAEVVSVVDKDACLKFDLEDIPVMNLNELKKQYDGELIIITPIQYYEQIHHDLSEFIPEANIMVLEKFLED
jgi:hypothetical protein